MNVAPPFLPSAIFELVRPLSALPPELRLAAAEWSLLLAITGRHSVAQLGALFGLAASSRDAAISALLALGLIRERPVTLAQFLLARDFVPADEPVTLAAFLDDDAVQVAEPPFVPLEVADEEIAMSSPNPVLHPRRLNLRALMEFLIARAPSEEAGQLDIYRVFLRIEPELLRESGISTLRFIDDRVVEDRELERLILDSVERTLGIACPPEVFV